MSITRQRPSYLRKLLTYCTISEIYPSCVTRRFSPSSSTMALSNLPDKLLKRVLEVLAISGQFEETHTMLKAFWHWGKLLQHLSTKDNQRNLCQDFLTVENTDSDFKVHALNYAMSYLDASDFPFQNFCKLGN